MCAGAAAVLLGDGHLFPVHRVAADGRVDRAGILTQIAADDALIRPGKAVILELRSKMRVRKVVFRGDEQAGCVLVDAVDDAGPLLTADAGERIAAMMDQRVDERPVRMAGRRMDDESFRLVDDDDVVVLVDHVQWNVLRGVFRGLRLRDLHVQDRPGRELRIFLDRPPVQRDGPVLQQPLHGAAAQLREQRGQRRVEPKAVSVQRQRHRSCPFSARRTGIPCP